jgi:prohibitin 2
MLFFFFIIYKKTAYLDVKKIEFAKEISSVLADSRNHIMLNSDIL